MKPDDPIETTPLSEIRPSEDERLKKALSLTLEALTEISSQMVGLEGRQYRWIRERCEAAIEKAKEIL